MKKPFLSIAVTAVLISLPVLLIIYAGYYPVKRFNADSKAFSDTLRAKYGFQKVSIEKQFVRFVPKYSMDNYIIELYGPPGTRSESKRIARRFKDHVLLPSYNAADTITIRYRQNGVVIYSDVFANEELP